jgi:sterol desaturase/sphingolipid hydroxylase (fatty acid hydroxylase superfamily)
MPCRGGWRVAALSVRIFKSSFLERLTFMPIGLYVPVWIAVLSVLGWRCASLRWFALLPLTGAGLLCWSLAEYAAHRFLFHLELRSPYGQRLIFVIHGNHHADPGDRLRNMMPLIVSLPLAALIWFCLALAAGQYGEALALGFVGGYFIYDLTHYAEHQFRLSNPLMRTLRRHHLRHHYVTPDANFAITTIFWDAVFKTNAPRRR